MSPDTATAATHRAAQLENALRKVIRGKDEVLRLALVSILARGHLLIEGVPGVGKTTLGQALARALDCTFQRVQFTSDMLPSDVLGISIYSAIEQQFEFKRGPVFANVLLADEINRTTPKTQSALLEAMNEGQVTVDAHSYPLPQPFLVIATQNPVEHHGTYPLPESQLDRFLMRVRMGYPDGNAEREIVRSQAGTTQLEHMQPVLSGADVLEMQQAVTQVKVDDSLVTYALAIVRKTRESEQFSSRSLAPRLADALPRRSSHGFSRWPHFLHARRFQAAGGPRLRPPRSGQQLVFGHHEKVRAGRAGNSGDRGERAGSRLTTSVVVRRWPVASSVYLCVLCG